MKNGEFPIATCPECGSMVELWIDKEIRKIHRYTVIGYGDYVPEGLDPILGRVVVKKGSAEVIQNDDEVHKYVKCIRNCGFRKEVGEKYVVISPDTPMAAFIPTPIPVQEVLFDEGGSGGEGWLGDSDQRT